MEAKSNRSHGGWGSADIPVSPRIKYTLVREEVSKYVDHPTNVTRLLEFLERSAKVHSFLSRPDPWQVLTKGHTTLASSLPTSTQDKGRTEEAIEMSGTSF